MAELMGSLNKLFGAGQKTEAPAPVKDEAASLGTYDDADLLKLWESIRKESIDNTLWVFLRQWMRNIYYVLGRQWITYHARSRGWRDTRMAPWIPRPVTNKCKTTVQAIRAMFSAIKLGVNVRPNGSDPMNASAAAVADELAPVLHEDHSMTNVLNEFDFWLITCGNAYLHTYLDYDMKYGLDALKYEQCLTCGEDVRQDKLDKSPVCPTCQGTEFGPSIGDDGQPKVDMLPKGKPVTCALSPLEVAHINTCARFSDLPYVVRLRWRTRHYFENHPALKALVEQIVWQSAPTDAALQMFKSLSTQNDLGVSSTYWTESGTTNSEEEGITEYEVTYKPCDAYPKGLIFRVYGDNKPIIAHLEETEAIPGPLPYTDAEGNPLFTYTHAGYDHVGGRILASGPIDVIAQTQDKLNQLDSMTMLSFMRTSNPVWLKKKGSTTTQITGLPGLVIEWDDPLHNGDDSAVPKRVDGAQLPSGTFQLREQYVHDIEELAGTFDIIKGSQPPNIEAFSALQLLVERSQARFASVFTARGEAYKDWYRFAIELERQYGPSERTKWTLASARQWTYQNFQRTQLQGAIAVVVEDGSQQPKTSLGMRAAVEHASQLGFLDSQDPDVRYEAMKLFGLTRVVPTLDIHVQAALRKQHLFEQWITDQNATDDWAVKTAQSQQQFRTEAEAKLKSMSNEELEAQATQALPSPPSLLEGTPLEWLPWYNPAIHRQEFVKWANSDRVRMFTEDKKIGQIAKALLKKHLEEIDQQSAIEVSKQQMIASGGAPPQPAGAGAAMANSNRESTSGNEPRGSAETAQNQGPA